MKIKKVGTKITAVFLAGVVLAVLTTAAILISGLIKVLNDNLTEQNRKSLYTMENQIELLKETSADEAVILSEDKALLDAVNSGDYQAIQSAIDNSYKENRLDTNNITITDTNGIVLCRYHSDQTGDLVISQENVAGALAGNLTTVVSEGTAVRFGVRSGMPIKDENGKIVGAVSVICSLDDTAFVDSLKDITGNEYTIYLGDERINTTILNSGERAIGTTLDPEIAKVVIENKEEYYGETAILGEAYSAAYEPIVNENGEAIGVIFSGLSIQEVVDSKTRTYIMSFAVVLIIAIALAVVMTGIVRKIVTKPLKLMTQAGIDLSNGMLDTHIDFSSNDELGVLAKAL